MDFTDPAAAIRALGPAPRTEVEKALAELAGPPGTAPSGTQLLVRAAAGARLYEFDSLPATLARALADHRASPVFGPQRDIVTRQLVLAQLRAAVQGQEVDLRRVAEMLDVPDDPDRPGTLSVLRGLALVAGALVDEPGHDLDAALSRVEEISAALPPHSEYAPILRAAGESLLVVRRQRRGEYDHPVPVENLSASFDPNSAQWLRTELMRLSGEAMSAAQRGDLPAVTRLLPEIEDIVDQLPLDDPATGQMRVLLSQLRGLMGGSTEPMRRDAELPGLSRAERAARLFMAATAEVDQAAQQQDAPRFAAGTARLRTAVDAAAPDDPQVSNYLTVLGRTECALFQLRGQRTALTDAIGHLEAAVRVADNPGQPMWSMAANALALAYRLDGRLAEGRRWGLRALRGNAWTVLLQETPEHATDAARHAADEGVEVARWCLADGDSGGAAVALDAGRGLLLAATGVTASVPERLIAAGRAELADRWRRQGGQNDLTNGYDLRYQALLALAGPGLADLAENVGNSLLDPPDLDQVRAALRAVDADALVYLLAADATGGGAAVLVPRDEAPYHVALPRLAARPGEQVHRYGRALATRDIGVKNAPEPARQWRAALDELCGWAWSAATGPLLDEARRWGSGRLPRLVLVPMGQLATVPWHAARSRSGRYAVQDAVFSYAPSARVFCDCAWRTPVDDSADSLVVGDPTGDLPDARDEATAIRDTYYPSATLLGSKDATPAAVLDWLRPSARLLLHLACHGALGPAGSYVSLAGRAELTARQLVETRGRATVGLVVLAACTTGVPSGSYDEAFSISTAFLAAGAATVFGSLWSVPSDATSLLMFMAHHYLRAERLRPADALHRAQLWMLDPARVAPRDMPPLLASRIGLVDRHDVAAWAAFTHLGR